MRAVDIIIHKRDKQELTTEEINFFIKGVVSGDIPDYQVSAWLMAILLNNMTDREATDLTMAMAQSGTTLDLSQVVPIAVDKHSTGGVGDKTSLVVEPLVASCGLHVGKMSGRGLGFSGGTLDKLESIPGYRTDLNQNEFLRQLKETGLVLTGQSGDLAPADGKLYALRDVTGTVQSIPLIASSIMSKKIAAGAQAIVLDVKVGHGAFMKTLEEAHILARLMVSIGKLSGRRVIALLSDMNQPLGYAIGNALEVKEAIETLHGGGPFDFREHCLTVASHLLVMGKKFDKFDEARLMAEKALEDGRAWEKFRTLVRAQGGDVRYVDVPGLLPKASHSLVVNSDQSGWVQEVNALDFGEASVDLGAGRAKKGDQLDLAVGILVHVKIGDHIEAGKPLYTIYYNDNDRLANALKRLKPAVKISTQRCDPVILFYGVVE